MVYYPNIEKELRIDHADLNKLVKSIFYRYKYSRIDRFKKLSRKNEKNS
ncbi:MAG: hypothetical protein ISQ89_06250 [Alphaproteobacteria bacterium]|nr:hypothetical protein [Alphaproteobacteria bacterium]